MKSVRRLDARQRIILCTLFCVLAALSLAAAGCGEKMARMEDNQIKLQAMMAANARQLATISSQVHVGQGQISQDFHQLGEKTQNVGAEVRTVQNQQAQLHATVVGGNQELHKRIALVEEDQHLLEEGVGQIANVTQRTAANVTAIARDQGTLHQMVQSNQAELTQNLSTVASHQETGIVSLQQANQDLRQQLAAMADQQTLRHQALSEDNEQVIARLTRQDAAQGQLDQDLDGLHTLTQTVAKDVTRVAHEQTALQATVQGNARTLVEKIGIVEQNQANIQGVVDQVANTTVRTVHDVTALAADQSALQKAHQTSYEALTSQLVTVAGTQAALQGSLGGLDQKADRTTAQLTGVAAGQDALQETLAANDRAVTARLTSLAAEQTTLHSNLRDVQDNLGVLTATTGQVALDLINSSDQQAQLQQALQAGTQSLEAKTDRVSAGVTTLAAGQEALHETVKTSNQALATRLTSVTDNQAALQSSLTGLDTKAEALTTGVAAVATRQVASQQQAQADRDALAAELTSFADSQEALHRSVDGLNERTGQVSADVVAMAAGQDALHQTLTNHNDAIAGQIKAVESNQQALGGSLDALSATTSQVARDVTSVGDAQSSLQKTVEAGVADLGTRVEKTAAEQGAMQDDLDILTATTTQVALDVITVGNTQADLRQTVKAGVADLAAQAEKTAAEQGAMQDDLDILTTTTTQVALDVIAVGDTQADLQQAIGTGVANLTAQAEKTAAGQGAMQDDLDILTATTTQVALDVMAAGDKQDSLEQAVETNRQTLVTRLAEIAQGQQQWLEQYDTAQAKVQTMTSSIAGLQEQLTKLQGTLQTDLQGMTTLLDAKGQDRVQFEAKINQDIQAMTDWVSQLRQLQTGLQEQMQQVQSSTQSQSEDILSALEQLRQQTEKAAIESGAARQSSMAEPQQIALP